MKKIFLLARTFWQQSDGVTSIEYALLASLIAMAILIGVGLLGAEVKAMWDRIAECVTSPGSCISG